MAQDDTERFLHAILGELRAEMARRRLTAVALADQSGMPRRTLTRKLNGDTEFTIGELHELCAAIGIDAGEVVTRAART